MFRCSRVLRWIAGVDAVAELGSVAGTSEAVIVAVLMK